MKNNLGKAALMLIVLLLAITTITAQGAKEEAPAAAASETSTRVYVDALGRENTLPYPIERIAPSGNPIQIMLYALCPEKMVGLGSAFKENSQPYILEEVRDLPVFGAFYGKKANLNKEAVIMAHPEVVIDVGEVKKGINEDLDALQKQLGIPVVFIEGHLTNTGDTLRELGKVIGVEDKAEELAAYAEKVLSDAAEKKAQIKKPVTAYYAGFTDPLSGYAKGSFHTEVLDLVGVENVVPETFTSKGGNQISMEQMLLWNPDIILMQDPAAYKEVVTDTKWAGLDAVKNGKVYLVPSLPYPLLTQPPAMNRIFGIYWLGTLCYPELYSDIDIEDEMKTFYDLFYHYELEDDEIDSILNR